MFLRKPRASRVAAVMMIPTRTAVVALLGAALCQLGCASEPAEPPGPSAEERILTEYFTDQPDVPNVHHRWHGKPAGENYGQAFLQFHRDFVAAYDDWRVAHGYERVVAWDPSTPIPPADAHPGRSSDDPSSIDPLCKKPPWLTREGGTDSERDPVFGARRLADYTSANQLGEAIDSQYALTWHNRVHQTIGGDMADSMRVPYDPIFWPWHRYIDDIWKDYEAAVAELE
jgi:hypothetical protein